MSVVVFRSLSVEPGRELAFEGVAPSDFSACMASGITGFGLGSSLFAVTASREDVIARGKTAVGSYDEARRVR